MSRLHEMAQEYLAIRRSLGFKLKGHDRMLSDFLDQLEASGSTTITTAAAVFWATSRPELSSLRCSQRLSVVRGFTRYLSCLDPESEVPPSDMLPHRSERRTPYLYSQEEITRLVEAAGALGPELRGATYATYLGLIAVTGMRMGEAIALDRDDVDLGAGTLTIRETKFKKHRRLPLHHSTVAALNRYTALRDRLCSRTIVPAFFVSMRGTRLLDVCVHGTFNKLLVAAGLDSKDGIHPRIHSLRHSFAVATLSDWHRQGVDPAGQISVLAAYLGHGDPAYTYWYLQACPELLGLAADRLERWEGGCR